MFSDDFTNQTGERITLGIDDYGRLVITVPRMIIEPEAEIYGVQYDEDQRPGPSLFDMSAFGFDDFEEDDREVDGE